MHNPIVLMYHGIIPYIPGAKPHELFSNFSSTLDRHLHLLKKYLKPLNPKDYIESLDARKEISNKSFVLTFDDGLQNFFDHALPVLRKHKIVPITFLNSQNLDNEKWLWFSRMQAQMVSGRKSLFDQFLKQYDQLKIEDLEAAMNNFDAPYKSTDPFLKLLFDGARKEDIYYSSKNDEIVVGGHTTNHPRLTNESKSTITREIVDNKILLEGLVGEKLELFSYPEGVYNTQVIDCVKEIGYKIAFTTDHPPPNAPNDDQFAIRRTGIYKDGDLYFLLKMLKGLLFNK